MRNFGKNLYLYILTDSGLSKGRSNEEIVIAAIAGGADVIQLRGKDYTGRQLLSEAFKLKAIIKDKGVPLIINDRVDVAIASDSDGVHLGQDDLPYKYARKMLGDERIIGITVHNLKEALEAQEDGADYIGVSSIFPTATKPDAIPLEGLEILTEIKKNVSIPVVAIGGIKEDNARLVGRAGADCIAIISAVVSAPDVKEAARKLKEQFMIGRKERR